MEYLVELDVLCYAEYLIQCFCRSDTGPKNQLP